MANTGRKIYQFLKQVDATTMIPTGVRKANNPGDPDYAAPVVDYVTCPVVSWQAANEFCVTTLQCAAGWTLVGGQCQQVETTAAAPPTGNGGTPGTVAKVNNNQWNMGGGRIYAPGYAVSGNGTVQASLLVPHLWINGSALWNANGDRNTVDSRINATGIWSVESTPNNEYIGFSRRVTVATARTLFIGMSGDNGIRIVLNGVTLVDSTDIDGGPNFAYWNIYPVDLIAGDNYIEVYGVNFGSVAGFGCEIYDMTADELIAATTEADLHVIFSTADLVGQAFDLGETMGWHCPPGWSLDTSGDTPVCKRMLTASPTTVNTGMKAYGIRRRYNAGVFDGYIEDNTETGGLGPYFPPVSDTITCPPPPPDPTPDPPSITEVGNVDNGDDTRTQTFEIGASVSANNRYRLFVYSHVVEVIATSGDTPAVIAIKLRDAINATAEAQWNEFGLAPTSGTPGFPPSANATGNQVIVTLNIGNSFACQAYVS